MSIDLFFSLLFSSFGFLAGGRQGRYLEEVRLAFKRPKYNSYMCYSCVIQPTHTSILSLYKIYRLTMSKQQLYQKRTESVSYQPKATILMGKQIKLLQTQMQQQKPKLNIIVLGQVDSGKSSTVGHLIHRFGDIPLATINEFGQISGAANQSYAWILDTVKEESERGNTIDSSLITFQTENYRCNIIEIPGHRNFTKNLILSTCLIDCAIMVVSSIKDEFELSLSSEGGQVENQILIAYALGIQNMIICVNKMDEINWNQQRYQEISTRMVGLIKKIGCKFQNILSIPLSAENGDNIVECSPNVNWFNGKTLLQAVNESSRQTNLKDRPLRFSLSDVYKIGGIGTVPYGTIKTGTITSEMKLIFAPPHIQTSVKSLECWPYDEQELQPGDTFGVCVRNLAVKDLKRGYVCSNAEQDPALSSLSFFAIIFIIQSQQPIISGYTSCLYCHNAKVECTMVEIYKKADKRNCRTLEENPKKINNGDVAWVRFVPNRPLCVEQYNKYPPLGRFIIRENWKAVAVGIITHVEKAVPLTKKKP